MLALLLKVRVPKEETGMVSDLRYGWKKLRKQGIDVSDQLAQMQVGFKRDLVKEVAAFVQDAQAFRKDWETNGPMVPGLDPMEAVDRLKKFQQMFEVRETACVPSAIISHCDSPMLLMVWGAQYCFTRRWYVK